MCTEGVLMFQHFKILCERIVRSSVENWVKGTLQVKSGAKRGKKWIDSYDIA